jgi:hypothetical protein
MVAILETSTTISDVGSGDCLPLTRVINIIASNGSQAPATLTLSCCASATIVPSSFTVPAGASGVSVAFTITHVGPSTGHTITVSLTQGATLLSSDEVTVSIGNPCPIEIEAMELVNYGPPLVTAGAALSGKFDKGKGNRITLLVEEPGAVVNGRPRRPRLIYADDAIVELDAQQGKWKHDAIPNARKGQHLRIVLTRDGVVVSTVRAVFK